MCTGAQGNHGSGGAWKNLPKSDKNTVNPRESAIKSVMNQFL
jgi:hypothetical protein